MTLGRLACHVAEVTQFGSAVANTDSMDFAKGDYKRIDASRTQAIAGRVR